MPENGLELKRDCQAVRIPSGEPALLLAGTPFAIAQTLGGSYTIETPAGLFRVAGSEAAALGIQPEVPANPPPGPIESLGEETIRETLRSCYDPEIPVNIVDLGLVYDLRLEPLPTGGNRVSVKMTLTAPGCGMGGAIAMDAQQKLLRLPGIEEADVEIVWDPPWHPSMISPAGRAVLGME